MSSRPDTRPPIVAAILVQDMSVLLVRRRVRERTLSWQFPAGEQLPEESPADAAERETLEEVGLSVVADRTIGERLHPVTGRRMIYVACALVRDAHSREARVIDTEELDDVMWCPFPEVEGYLTAGVYPPVLEYLRRCADRS